MSEEEFPDLKDMDTATPKQQSHLSPNRKTKHSFRNIAVVVLVAVLVIAVGGGLFWYLKHHASTKNTAQKQSVNSQSVRPAPASTAPTTTKEYVSNEKNLNLSFNYPSSWTVTPVTTTSTSTEPIIANSPLTTITNASGSSVTGKVVVMVRTGDGQVSELSSGNAHVIQDSHQIAFTQPTAVQHQYPYLTFVHLSSDTNKTAIFEEAMITGVVQFKAGDPLTTAALTGVDPIISARFYTCTNSDCSGTGATNLSITTSTWDNAAFFKQVQALLQSFKLN